MTPKGKDRLNILFVCGYGVGTSVIMEYNVQQALDKIGLKANMEHAAGGDANSFVEWADVIGISKKLISVVNIDDMDDVFMVEIVNVMDGDKIVEDIMEVVKEHFPELL